jgi:hypothetical protein
MKLEQSRVIQSSYSHRCLVTTSNLATRTASHSSPILVGRLHKQHQCHQIPSPEEM